MRDLTAVEIDCHRDRSPAVLEHYGTVGDATCGVFVVRSPVDREQLRIVASSGEGWDHVSVSRRHHAPYWRELEFVKRMFFRDDEYAMQLHVPAPEHINLHPRCLHLWRPLDVELPLPPAWMVG